MVIAILAEALASEAPALNLNLVCEGHYQDVETSTARTSGLVNGELRTGTAVIKTPVTRTGVARLSFQGAAGKLTYPDGVERVLGNVTADTGRITADYQRKVLFITVTWKVEVNRMTGAVRVADRGDVTFEGLCAPESTQPKF